MASLPTILSIDLESDRRLATVDERVPWDGWDRAYELFSGLRPRLEGATGGPVHYSWFFRTDAQVAQVWGSGGWAIETRREHVADLEAHGDEIGVHFHPFRWDEPTKEWICDFGDPVWVARNLDDSLDAFERATGRPCRSFRFGARWMDGAALAHLARRGVACDLSAEPGFEGGDHVPADETYAGVFPDYGRAPRIPHRAADDPLVEDSASVPGLWMVPVSTASPERRWRAFRRAAAGLLHPARGRPRPWIALDLVESPRLFLRALDHLLASRSTRHLQIVVRSDGLVRPTRANLEANLRGVAERARAFPISIVRPDEALSTLFGPGDATERLTPARPPVRGAAGAPRAT